MKLRNYIWIGLIFIVLFFLFEKRSFYYSADKTKCFTIWKKIGGKCVIIPGKYLGLWSPANNFLITENKNSLTIVWGDELKFDFVILNNYGGSIKAVFKPDSIRVFGVNESRLFYDTYYVKNKIRPGLEYLMIDIKENLIVLNGEKM